MLNKFLPESMAKATKLFNETANLTLDQITAEHVCLAADLLGYEAAPAQVDQVLKLAKLGDPKGSLIEWAKGKLEDGTIARVLNPPPKSILHRCDFCGQPNTVPLTD